MKLRFPYGEKADLLLAGLIALAYFINGFELVVLASFGYFILVEVLFLAVYGERYRESFELARLLVILPFLVSLRMFFVNIFTAKGKNTFIVSVYVVANILSMILFIVMFKTAPFVWSAGAYLYSINLLLLIPLAFAYFFNASKKTDSI